MRIVVVHPGSKKKKRRINGNPPITGRLQLSCLWLFLCFGVFRTERFFVVTSCHGWLGPPVSDGGVWIFFFCPRGSVIRCPTTSTHQPTLLLSANVMQRISKYCLRWLKTAHYLRLLAVWFEPPQSNACNPKRRRYCHPKDDLPSFFFHNSLLINSRPDIPV